MIKGSYFPNESWDFENGEKIETFVAMLKSRGCYIGEDWHIRSAKGGNMSKLNSCGYWITMARYNKKCYYFCEHRVIWVWINGSIPEGMQINHKDYNRGNNNISNLEVVTAKENFEYSRCHYKPMKGEKNGNSKFTDEQVGAIRFLATHAGWSQKKIHEFVGTCSPSGISRIINKNRYKDVPTPESLLSVYPILVEFTRNKTIGIEEEIKNYCMGLSGEVGELVDLMKKNFYHGKEVNPSDVLYELGDILYYLVAVGQVLGFDFSEIAANNNVKLLARYKDGYSIEQSLNRIEDKHKEK